MNDHTLRPATPPDAPAGEGASQNTTPSPVESAAAIDRAGVSAAVELDGGAEASDVKTMFVSQDETPWPPPGDAVLTTDEGRLYLFDRHDIFLKERYTQKLVSEHKKLLGRTVPKDGGGSELQISQASLDEYARLNPQKKNAADVVLDPDDKLFDDFRRIAQSKPFKYAIKGDARPPSETPAPAWSEPPQPSAPAQEEKATVEPAARAGQGDAPASVALETYNQLKTYTDRLEKRLEALEETNVKLYETLDSTYDKMLDQNAKILELSARALAAQEKPSELIKQLAGAMRAAQGQAETGRLDVRSADASVDTPEREAWRRERDE